MTHIVKIIAWTDINAKLFLVFRQVQDIKLDYDVF